jgi:hypothetical protein
MPDMLGMTAFKFRDPVPFAILVKSGYPSVHDATYSFMFRSSSVPSARSSTR